MSAVETWGALSQPQRRVVLLLTSRPGRLVRSAGTRHFYDFHGEPHAESRIAGLLTVRNLERRELLAWDGGAFDPERRAVVTEPAHFVVKHGSMERGDVG